MARNDTQVAWFIEALTERNASDTQDGAFEPAPECDANDTLWDWDYSKDEDRIAHILLTPTKELTIEEMAEMRDEIARNWNDSDDVGVCDVIDI